MKLKTVLKTTAISAVLLTLSFSNIKYSAILVKADHECRISLKTRYN